MAATMAALAPGRSAKAADEPPAKAALEWTRDDGGEGCIDAARLGRAVEEILARTVFVEPDGADVTVHGSIARAPGPGTGWRARLVVRTRDGREAGLRELETSEASCAALDGPLPLVVAMMVDLRRESVTLSVPSPPAPPPQASPSGTPSARTSAPARASEAHERWTLASSASAAVAVGLLPGVAVGARADLSVAPPRWPRMAMSLSVWPSARVEDGGRGAVFSAWYAGLSVCPNITRGRVGLDACGGLSVGATTATGVGLDVTRQDVRASALVEARAVLAVVIVGPIGAELALGGAIPFTRTTFVYTDASEDRRIYLPPPVLALGSLGLRASLP